MRARPGEVWRFDSGFAKYPKFHLCVSEDLYFLLINTPTEGGFPGDLRVPNKVFPFLEPTACGTSIICCNRLVDGETQLLPGTRPKLVGSVPKSVMVELVTFLEQTDAITDEERDLALEGLLDYYALAA